MMLLRMLQVSVMKGSYDYVGPDGVKYQVYLSRQWGTVGISDTASVQVR